MDVISTPEPTWEWDFTCMRCSSELRATLVDLELDGFKVSGAFWNDTAVCEDKIYVTCVVCSATNFVPKVATDTIPFIFLPKKKI